MTFNFRVFSAKDDIKLICLWSCLLLGIWKVEANMKHRKTPAKLRGDSLLVKWQSWGGSSELLALSVWSYGNIVHVHTSLVRITYLMLNLLLKFQSVCFAGSKVDLSYFILTTFLKSNFWNVFRIIAAELSKSYFGNLRLLKQEKRQWCNFWYQYMPVLKGAICKIFDSQRFIHWCFGLAKWESYNLIILHPWTGQL